MFKKGKNSFSFFRKLISYIAPETIEILKGESSPYLTVKLANGRLELDGEKVNYSFGGLHVLFQQIFKKINLKAYTPDKILILGFGVGSVMHILRNEYRFSSMITGVESDKVIIELWGKYFHAETDTAFSLYPVKAEDYLKSCNEKYDLIIVDIFIEDEVPESIRTSDFVALLSKALFSHGVLIYNFMVNDEKSGQEFENLKIIFTNYFYEYKTYTFKNLGARNRVLVVDKRQM